MAVSQFLDKTRERAGLLVKRATDRHVRLAVTGLSGSGKTAFITSLVHQLTQGNLPTHLPLFSAVREHRLQLCERVLQADITVPAFQYREAMGALDGRPPQWPDSTKGISELRLRLDFQHRDRRWLAPEHSTLWLDIVDYPGEWLLDLPLLNQNFRVWSQRMHSLLREEPRWPLARDWLAKVEQLDWTAAADHDQISELAAEYAELLADLHHQQHLSLLQPGRFLLPGELAGAPVLQFFPVSLAHWPAHGELAPDSLLMQLEQRFEHYKKAVVKPFYERHFRYFDRQIVLADCFTSLNQGYAHCQDMANALSMAMESFRYGQQTWLSRLFNPNIDKVLFAASKADHVTREQFANTQALLESMTVAHMVPREDVEYRCQPLAAVRCTHYGQAHYQGESMPTIKGLRMHDRESITVFPGDVPKQLPDPSFFQTHPFEFVQFAPLTRQNEFEPMPHIGMDKALEFLLGDKLS